MNCPLHKFRPSCSWLAGRHFWVILPSSLPLLSASLWTTLPENMITWEWRPSSAGCVIPVCQATNDLTFADSCPGCAARLKTEGPLSATLQSSLLLSLSSLWTDHPSRARKASRGLDADKRACFASGDTSDHRVLINVQYPGVTWWSLFPGVMKSFAWMPGACLMKKNAFWSMEGKHPALLCKCHRWRVCGHCWVHLADNYPHKLSWSVTPLLPDFRTYLVIKSKTVEEYQGFFLFTRQPRCFLLLTLELFCCFFEKLGFSAENGGAFFWVTLPSFSSSLSSLSWTDPPFPTWQHNLGAHGSRFNNIFFFSQQLIHQQRNCLYSVFIVVFYNVLRVSRNSQWKTFIPQVGSSRSMLLSIPIYFLFHAIQNHMLVRHLEHCVTCQLQYVCLTHGEMI